VFFKPAKPYFYTKWRKYRVDCALICLHGAYGEDGATQGLMEMLGIPYTCSCVAASAECMDKDITKKILRADGVSCLDWRVITKDDFVSSPSIALAVAVTMGYPVIVKPARCGSSVGISIARDEKQLTHALGCALEYDEKVIIEHALEDFTELNCAVLKRGEKYVVSEVEMPLRQGDFLDYFDKYGASGGKRLLPAPIDKGKRDEIRSLAVRAFKSLSMSGVARIDFLVDKDGKTYVNEVNSIPGSLSFYLFPDIPASEICSAIIEDALFEFSRKNARKTEMDGELFSGK
jgi:D-alanine-D-alanine ligase